jgi:hypothetical protein
MSTKMSRWLWGIMLGVFILGLFIPLECLAQTLQGYVYDSETGSPIPYAWVDAFINDNWYWTDSMTDGSYSLETESGLNEIYVWAQGYEELVEEIDIPEGGTISRNFYLQPSGDIGVIEGLVKDCETGEPIRNARIETDTGEYTYTDASGTYTMELPSGFYFITIGASGYREIWDFIWVDDLWVDLGETCLYDEDSLGLVSGFVRDSVTGSPVSGAFLSLSDYPFYGLSDEDGFYQIEVPPRSVELMIDAEGYVSESFEISLSAGEFLEHNFDLEGDAEFDDHCNEPAECATELQVNGDSLPGTIGTAGDKDWFKFEGTAGVEYVIDTSDLGTGSDTVMSLFRDDGTTLIVTDDDGGDGLASRIVWTADQTGLFFIKVTHYSASGTGTYRISILGLGGPDDHCNEPSDCATELQPNGNPVQGTIGTAGDEDWFRFTAVPGLVYELETFNLGMDSDTVMELYRSDGTSLIQEDDDGGEGLASHIIWVPDAQETVYILIRQYFSSGTGSYNIRVTVSDDHCDTLSSCATYLIPNDTPVQGSFEIDGDEDWFQFYAGEGLEYVIETSNLSSSPWCDTVISLFNSDGERIAVNDDISLENYASSISWTASSAGTYYIRVRDYYSGSRGSYNISVSATWATLLTNDGTLFSDSLVSGSDMNFYIFMAEEGRSYTIETTNLSDDCDTFMQIWEPDGVTVIAYNDDCEVEPYPYASRIDMVAEVSGPHHIVVVAYDDNSIGDYDISVLEGDDHPDSLAAAEDLPTNGTRAHGEFESTGDEDWFRFEAVANELYVIETGSLDDECDTVLELYDEDGSLMAFDDDSGEGWASQLGWVAPYSGSFYICVRHYYPEGIGSYDIWVLTMSSDDHGDIASEATTMIVDDIPISGGIDRPGDIDLFQFEAEMGVTYIIETSELGTGSDTVISLFREDGTTLIVSDDDGGDGLASRIVWTADQTGPFFISVGHYAPSGTGAYEVSIRQQVEICTTIETNQPVYGNLSQEGEGDLYCLPVSGGSTIEVELQGPASGADFDLYVKWGSAPSLSVYDARGFTATSQEQCALSVTSSGTLYIWVRSYGGTGDYTLTAQETEFQSGCDETLAEGIAQEGSLSGTGDGRMYCIEVSEGDDALVTLDGPDSGTDMDLYLKFGSVPTLSDYDTRGYTAFSDEVAALSNLENGTLYIWVVSYSGAGDYTIEAYLSSMQTDCVELTEGAWNDSDRLDFAFDQRNYCFNLDEGQQISVILDGPANADFDLYLRFGSPDTLYNPDVVSWSLDSQEEIQYTATAAGPVYITVWSYSGFGEYSIQVSVLEYLAVGFAEKSVQQTPGEVLYVTGSIVDTTGQRITPNSFCITVKDLKTICYNSDPNISSEISFLPGGHFFFTLQQANNPLTCTLTNVPCYRSVEKDFTINELSNMVFEIELNSATDCDGDGMLSGWEKHYGLNIWKNDASLDLDQDRYTNFQEYNAGTNPNDKDSFPSTSQSVVKGDIDGDGKVTLADAIIALQVLLGMDPAGVQIESDVNGDNKIGMEEVVYILQYKAYLREH